MIFSPPRSRVYFRKSFFDMPMETVIHSFNYSLDYLREQVADLCDCQMVRQAPGVPNHPAWTIGHLIFIAQAIGGVAGLESWLEEEWANAFGPGSTPVAETLSYQSKTELLFALADAEAKLTAAVEKLDDSALDAPFPDPSYKEIFPTVRHALTQVLVGHTAFHVGQLSPPGAARAAFRRCKGPSND